MDRDDPFEAHRLEQVRRWAASTTWEDRLAWLESALKFAHELGIDYLEQKRCRVHERRPNG
jgi:hypothetical protein